jgi:hypothetical protein
MPDRDSPEASKIGARKAARVRVQPPRAVDQATAYTAGRERLRFRNYEDTITTNTKTGSLTGCC